MGLRSGRIRLLKAWICSYKLSKILLTIARDFICLIESVFIQFTEPNFSAFLFHVQPYF